MSDDESSALSSAPSEDDTLLLKKKDGILKFFSKAPKPGQTLKEISPPRPKREPSPPHEYVLADNPDIAFIVMFRARFSEAFPKSLINFGPQELERDAVDAVPGEAIEHLLCALLGLLLNRKQDVKPGHYNRALEDAISTHKSQWPKDWENKNPLVGGVSFASMAPTQRLTLLKTLILWALSSSDIIKGIITASYKQSRHEDDLNQALSVQPWGADGDKRRYFLIEGLDDTHFRVYRESNHTATKRTWWSVAGDIDGLKELARKLEKEDGGQKARSLSVKMLNAIPRFEATEEKRKRREYRQSRKQQFKRPEPNFSMYEGRTRGKRMKYTYSDEEDEGYSDATARRSSRNTGTHTPAESLAPTVTLSGRQVKSRQGGAYGESILSGTQAAAEIATDGDGGADEHENNGERPRRTASTKKTNGWGPKGAHIEGYNSVDEMDSDEDDASEQDYGDDEEDDHISLASEGNDQDEISDGDDEMADEDLSKESLVVKLPVKTPTPERKISKSQTGLDPSQTSTVSGSHQQADLAALTSNGVIVEGEPSPFPSSTVNGIGIGHTAKASDIAANHPNPPAHSPLAVRSSPEKPHAFPASFDIGVRES